MKKHSIVILAVVWMLVVVAGATMAITMSLMGVSSAGESAQLIDGSVRVSDQEYDIIKRYARLDDVRNILKTEFYQELDDEQLVLGAVRGMMSATEDAYTFYYTPEEMLSMNEHSSGVYEGVGLVLSADSEGYLTVLKIFRDTPAMTSGIRPGDHIVKINGTAVSAETSKQMDDAIAMIKESKNSKVKVTVLRNDELTDFDITKAKISISRTDHRMLSGDVGYIAIYEFMGNDVTGFKTALSELKSGGMKALIIDVRSNPGGNLLDVVSICDLLLPKGLIVYTEDRYGRREEYFSDENALGMPLAVLTNGMSASASEILAGAVQDYGAGLIVGEKTFGKGIVQTQIPFRSDGAGMRLTTARYYTPKGRSIHGTGIKPDVVVSQDENRDQADIELNPEHDAQLMSALELMEQKLKR